MCEILGDFLHFMINIEITCAVQRDIKYIILIKSYGLHHMFIICVRK